MFHLSQDRPRGAIEIERIVEHRDTVLRIGLVHDNRLISDQAFSTDQHVNIGGERKDTIVLDNDYVGPTVRFIRHHDGTATVHVPGSSRLCLARGKDNPRYLPELLRRGHAIAKNDTATVHVPMGSRGRVVMGPYTVLFQVIRRRVRVPVLPGQGFFKRLVAAGVADPVWSACLALSILLVGSLTTQAVLFQAQTGKYLEDARAPEEPDRGPVYIPVDPVEKEPPKPATAPVKPDPKPDPKPVVVEPKPDASKRDKVKPDRRKRDKARVAKADDTPDPTDRKRNLRSVDERVAAKTIAGAFEKKGGGIWQETKDADEATMKAAFNGGGASSDEGTDPSATKLIGSSTGLRLEKVATQRRPKWGKRDKKAVASNRPRKEMKIARPHIALSDPLQGTGAHKDQIARVLRRKNSAVRRCYESALRTDPGLGGKVTVSFVVGTAGTVTSVRIVGASGDFARCIETKFRRIRGLPMLTSPASFKQAYVFTKK